MMHPDDAQLTEAEACARLHISRETMRKRRLAGQIARCKGGKAVRYWRSEVDRHGSDPAAMSPDAAPAIPAPPMAPVLSPLPVSDWDRCVAECKHLGIGPEDHAAISAVMNRIYADGEKQSWDDFDAKR
ncbi:helix-turn-helix transcriptional regulator [Bosea sp. NPDC055353]